MMCASIFRRHYLRTSGLFIYRQIWTRDEAFEDRKDRGASARKRFAFAWPLNSPSLPFKPQYPHTNSPS